MSLIGLLLVLIVIGVLLWVVQSVIPMDPRIRTIISAVVVIFVVIWLLELFGLIPPLGYRFHRVY